MRLFRINIGLPSTNSVWLGTFGTYNIQSAPMRVCSSWVLSLGVFGERLTEARPFIFKCHGLKANLHSNHVLRSSCLQVALIDPFALCASATAGDENLTSSIRIPLRYVKTQHVHVTGC